MVGMRGVLWCVWAPGRGCSAGARRVVMVRVVRARGYGTDRRAGYGDLFVISVNNLMAFTLS